MPCPACGANTRSVGMESGDEKRCSHCGIPLVVVESAFDSRHWELVDIPVVE